MEKSSEVYRRNNNGPKTLPCGNPDTTLTSLLRHWSEVLYSFWFVYTIYIYFRYGGKLNSLFLEDLFIQKVYIGRWLRRSYLRSHRFTLSGYLSLGKWFQYFGLSHSTALVLRMFMSRMYWIINGARLLTENDRQACFLHRAQAATELLRLFVLCTYVTE